MARAGFARLNIPSRAPEQAVPERQVDPTTTGELSSHDVTLDMGLAPAERVSTEVVGKTADGGMRAAGQFAFASASPIARKQQSGANASIPPEALHALVARASAGGGEVLPPAHVHKFSSLGIDLSNVRVHTDSAAAGAADALGARAFASGDQIFFATGQYNPGSSSGDRLLAHELAHVAQHAAGELGSTTRLIDPADSVESAADVMAEAMLSGKPRPAVTALRRVSPGQVVARKPKQGEDPKASPDEEYSLPDDVEDFAIAPDGWSALVRTSWLKENPKPRLFQMLQQMQRLGAFTWAKEADLRRVAELTTPILEGHEVVQYNITLRTLAQMGLPPLSGALVAHESDKLIAAIKVPGLKEGPDPYPLRYDDIVMFEHAVESFTGLTVKNHLRRSGLALGVEGLVVRDGIVEVQISDAQAAEMFGKQKWSHWKKEREKGSGDDDAGGDAADKPADVSSEISLSERMHVEGWLRTHLELVDSGPVTSIDRTTLNVIDEIEKDPTVEPYLKQLLQKKTTSPGRIAGTFALEELFEAAKSERDRQRLGVDKLDQGNTKALGPDEKLWNIEGRLVEKGEVYADREKTFKLELDWTLWRTGRSTASEAEFAKRPWHDEVEWAVERLDKPDKPYVTKQSHDASSDIELPYTFKLGADEESGRFRVHAFMRSSHFPPKHFTTDVEVKTERARLDELEKRDLGDMTDGNTMSMNYKFDIGTGSKILSPIAGHDEDTHGYATSGPLPKDFKHLDPAARLKQRNDELELQRNLAAYLRLQEKAGKYGYNDAALAAEQRIKFLEKTESKLKSDEESGWTGFEIRGTYLSRDNDVPSGTLDLYGYQRVVTTTPPQPAGKAGFELPPKPPVTKFEVKIRDLSNKIETDLEFGGDDENFDDALREAFVKLAKAYPDGKVSVIAEDMVLVDKQAKTTGRSIGYELGTNSAWKRTKAKVWDPVVQVLTNAAALAVMIIFPPSAAVIVPMLAVTDIVNNVDDMVTKHDKGKLTFKSASIDLLQIGLDLLPFARGAKVLNPAKSAIEEAKGMANMRLVLFDAVQLGGQFVVMYERTKEQLVEIQEKQIAVLADKYRALIELQTQVANHEINPSDPKLAQKQAEIEADAKAIRDTVTTTWTQAVQHQATFFVGAHLIGGGEETAVRQDSSDEAHLDRSVPIEVTQLRRTGENHWATEPNALRVVHDHYESQAGSVSKIQLDESTGIAHFEITNHGVVTRVEAQLGHIALFGELRGAANKIVGHSIDRATGLDLIEKLNTGDASALSAVGITDVGTGKLPENHEFGLGELPDGSVVLVVGEPGAVDWAHLPGMKPRGHTHPPGVHAIPVQEDGTRAVKLPDLLKPTPDPFIPREVVFPSGADVIVMAHQNVDGHVVVTSFVVREGVVMQAPPGDHGPRLVFAIEGAHALDRTMPDGRRVYKARVVGKQGGETQIDTDIWVVAFQNDEGGSLFMTEPANMIKYEPPPEGWEEISSPTSATAAARPKKLSPTELNRRDALMGKWRSLGITELRELKRLREQSSQATYEPETPEHKVAAWDNSGTDKDFATWSPVYHRNIKNSATGLGREADFREALDNGNGVVASRVPQTSRGPRQVDAAMPTVYIQLKSEKVTTLSRKRQGGQLSNLEAIQRDRLLDRPVVWVVEGKATQPLRDMLNGIDPPDVTLVPPQGPKLKIELFEGPGAFDAAVKKYRLPPKKGSQ